MLIQSLEQKTRLAMMTVIATIAGSVIICATTVLGCWSMIDKERQQIYILDGEIPFLAERAQLSSNFEMEARAHINHFHQLFFNLPPDDSYMRYTVGKALYMADGSALKQKQALDEKGFYSDLLSSSAICTVMCDSIQFEPKNRKFTYYGTQSIKRRSREMKRSLITAGEIESVPRTENNPHGLMITNWRTIENKDLTTW